MKLKVCCAFLTGLMLIAFESRAQQSGFYGWLVSSHEQELSKKWKLLTDVQLRSAERVEYLETLLLRPALSYSFTKSFSGAIGYAYLGNWEKTDTEKTFEKEHRVWEQIQYEKELGATSLTNRLRLEQRSVEGESGYEFSQRLRYYVRAQIPFSAKSEFKKGWYTAVQNEFFANVQNKKNVNGKFFDQNRAYLSFGFRFSEAVDLEAGYLYRYQVEEEKMHHHIVQVQVITSL